MHNPIMCLLSYYVLANYCWNVFFLSNSKAVRKCYTSEFPLILFDCIDQRSQLFYLTIFTNQIFSLAPRNSNDFNLEIFMLTALTDFEEFCPLLNLSLFE